MTPTLTQPDAQSIRTRLYWAWRKWRALVGMFVQDGLAYKANIIIWILTDAVTATVMPVIWLAFPTDIFLGKLTFGMIEMRLFTPVIWILVSLLTASALRRGRTRRFAAFGI